MMPSRSSSFLVGPLDRDDADQQVFSQPAEGGQGRAGGEPTLADLALDALDDLPDCPITRLPIGPLPDSPFPDYPILLTPCPLYN